MRFFKPLIGAAAALALSVAPVATTAALAETTGTTSIRIGSLLDRIDTLNPFTSIYQQALDVLELEYPPLAGTDESGKMGVILAEDFSAEGKVWTYEIREDANWSDGKPVTADDVVWTYDAVRGDKDLQVANGDAVRDVVKVTAVDEKTVTIETQEEVATHPGILPVVPKHVWETIDDPANYENTSDVVGSGPFIMTAYEPGVSLTMEANPHYWGGETGVDTVLYSNFKNTDAMVLALRNNEIDMAGGFSAAQFESLAGVNGVESYQADSSHLWYLNISSGWKTTSGEEYGTTAEVLKDVEFRMAIGQVIDRDLLVDRILNGLGTQGPAMIPPGSAGDHFTELEDVARTQGVDAAKQALEDAGYTTDDQGRRLDKDGKPITLRLMYAGDSTSTAATAEFLESWFKDLGIPLKMKNTNWDEMAGNLIPKGDYDMYIDGWGFGPDPDYMLSINTCAALPDEAEGSSNSMVGMCDPEFDKLYAAQHAEQDPAKRTELVIEAQQKIYEYGSVAPFYYDDSLGAYRSDRLENLVIVRGSPYNMYSLAKATIKGADGGDGGGNQGLFIGIGVAVVAALAIGGFALSRRKNATADDRK